MSSASNTPPEAYFNDLSLPTGNPRPNQRSKSPGMGVGEAGSGGDVDSVPKPKRIACIICRKRKLKCDGTKPSCSTCTRLGHSCAYDEVRRKSGPKRGYVKALEERLKQVETLLKTQDPVPPPKEATPSSFSSNNVSGVTPRSLPATDFGVSNASIGAVNGVNADRWGFNGESPVQPPMDDLTFTADMNMGMPIDGGTFTWEMIGLGLEEPLPPQETIDELHAIYFDKIAPSLPMIHKYRYLAAMNLAPNQRPPVALRYIMWALAASVQERFFDLKDHLYQRSRKYVEMDSLKGHGEHMISVANAQTHVLLASYEFKMMYFPRAWISTGTAIRLCQMMGLHRLDGVGLDVKQCLPPPRDWTEREERRRTFWMSFCEDRYASIGTGWPMTIDEKDILSDLPSSEEAFEMSKAETTQSLTKAMDPSGACKLSPFAGVVLMACLFGRNLIHLHRPDEDDRDSDLNGEFWKRHRQMDNILLNTSLSLPSHLKLPNGLSNANIVFTNMNIHTSTICLHQAAIFKADKNRLPSSISSESKVRCITAANEIASIMRMVSHMDLSSMNPFISFCLYVAARVFVQYLKSRPDDSQTGDSLRFLLSAMNALKRKNPLTESFLVQLDVDLEGLGMRNPKYKSVFAYSDDNLGISSSTMPTMGKAPFNGLPLRKGNECLFMKINEDVHIEESSPTVIAPGNADSAPRNGEDSNWIPFGGQSEQGHDVQRTLQGLALGTTEFGTRGNFTSNSSYIHSESSNNGGDALSPDTANSSSRPTPSSTAPSDSRSNLQGKQANSANVSHETSPAASNNASNSLMGAFFPGQPDYANVSSSGLSPGNNFLPETPGRQFDVPGWEMSNTQTTGLTPVGEGVFRQLMGLGPMDPM
ncbi:fungal-specific transcription factor domain-containing protein [Amylocarpus encephaloides]|uniref:Fungal-specific transcription factor domain-containing protein n=1 Tax=Amylocarpus encephaloides TaxID=45428 RepID=A0A9P7YRS3_9HELO|nr:fungal-specific transcription factor domain-containing protein [Amylocarpus encephaloides]